MQGGIRHVSHWQKHTYGSNSQSWYIPTSHAYPHHMHDDCLNNCKSHSIGCSLVHKVPAESMATYLESGVERLEVLLHQKRPLRSSLWWLIIWVYILQQVPTTACISQDDCEHVLRRKTFSSPGLEKTDRHSLIMSQIPTLNVMIFCSLLWLNALSYWSR